MLKNRSIADVGPDKLKVALMLIQPFTENDFQKFDVPELLAGGIEINVIDLSSYLFPGASFKTHGGRLPDGIVIHTLADEAGVRGLGDLLAGVQLIICGATSGHLSPATMTVMRIVSDAPAPYMIIYRNAVPVIDKLYVRPSLWQRFQQLNLKNSVLNRIPLRLLGVRPADYVVWGGEASRISMRLIDETTTELWSYAESFHQYQQTVTAPPQQEIENTAVFIDQNFGFHPDYVEHGGPGVINPDKVYPYLRNWFGLIEKETGLRVVIAAHPRADYSAHPEIFGDREIRYGETPALIRDCRLAVCFYSTAVNLAVLFGKPLSIISLPELRKIPSVSEGPYALAASMKKSATDVSRPGLRLPADILDVDAQVYRRFAVRYIKSKGCKAKGIADIVFDICATHAAPALSGPSQDRAMCG